MTEPKRAEPAAASRNEALRAVRRLGRRIWKKWSGYHRRSLVETKMHCFKRLGERVQAPRLGVASRRRRGARNGHEVPFQGG